MITAIHRTKVGEVENKIPPVIDSVTASVINTKIDEVENKIHDHTKYITTPKFNEFAGSISNAKLKPSNLVKIVVLMQVHNMLIVHNKAFLIKMLWAMIVFKVCFFINQHLTH